MKRKVVYGILLILVGFAIVFWAYNHSPHTGLGNRLMSELSGSFTLSKQQYAGTMIGGIILGILGIYLLFKK